MKSATVPIMEWWGGGGLHTKTGGGANHRFDEKSQPWCSQIFFRVPEEKRGWVVLIWCTLMEDVWLRVRDGAGA